RAALSWGPAVTAHAEEVEGGHRVTGEWMMSSGSRHATWLGLQSPVVDRQGAPAALPNGALCVFLVRADAVEWVENWDVIGLRATNSGGYKVANVFVPAGYSALLPQQLGTRIATPLYKFPLNAFFAVGFSAVAI